MIDRPKQRIVIATTSLDVGGTENHLTAVAPALAACGWPVTVYCFNSRGVQADALARRGVEVIGPPLQANLNHTPRLLRLLYLPFAMLKFGWLLLRRRPAIVHFFLGEPYMAGAPIAMLAGVRLRVMSRRSLNHYLARIPGAARIERWLHQRMSAMLGNSHAILRDLAGEGCPPPRLGLIYNGVAIDTSRPQRMREAVRRELGIGPHAVVAITVANLHPYKGHADLITALGAVHARLPREWALLCVGRDLGTQIDLEAQAAALGIAGHVRFLGTRTDVWDLLAAADLGLLCSHEEGFSNAIIEKMASGLPVIATAVGGNPEAVEDGVTGIVVPPRSPARLGAAIETLMSDADRRSRFGTAGRRRVEARFTMEACVAAYDALYAGLLDGKQPANIPAVAASEPIQDDPDRH